MILADTSAWIEYDRGSGGPVDRRMADLVDNAGPLVITEPVAMELLSGARAPTDEAEWHRLLLRFDWKHFDAAADFDAATRIYRSCRRAGFTPRGLIDCMIAAVAWRSGATLLCRDADLDRIATVVGIELDEASLRT